MTKGEGIVSLHTMTEGTDPKVCHCEPADGGRGNLFIMQCSPAVIARSSCKGNLQACHCEPAGGRRGNLVFQEKKDCKIKSLEKRLPRLLRSRRLAMTKGEGIVSLHTMTEGTDPKVCHCEPADGGRGNPFIMQCPLAVIARLPVREAAAISILLKNIFP
jgi:hypothetical protein